MKKIYLSFFMLAAAAATFAQPSSQTLPFSVANPFKVAQSTNSTDTLMFKYCEEPVTMAGFSANYEVEAAIRIPATLASRYTGASITKLIFAFGYAATNTSIFVRSSDSDAGYTQAATFAENSVNEIVLTTPYVISNQDIFIGYKYKGGGTSAFYSMVFDRMASATADGGIFRGRASSTTAYSDWYTSAGQGWGNIHMIAVITGDNLPQADVNLETLVLPHSSIATGESFNIQGTYKNVAAKRVTSLEVSYQIGQETAVNQTIAGLSVGSSERGEFTIENVNFAGAANTQYPVTVTINKVNNINDESPAQNSLSGTVRYWNAPANPVNVSTSPANKNVILEEYTGINCQYCPDGHKRANQLITQNPGRVYAINIHQGGYATGATPNYTTVWGDALANQTGLQGYPSGTVNRHIFTGNATTLNRGEWATYAPQILSQSSYVNAAANATIDFQTRKLTVTVELYYTANSTVSNNLNVAILQDSIMGPQISGQTYYPEMVHDGLYQHNHMLRELLTGQWGDIISAANAGTYVVKQYVYDVPRAINDVPVNLQKLEILAFVAEGHQEIITGTDATQNLIFSAAPLSEITKAEQLLQHSADLLVKEQIVLQNTSQIPVSSVELHYSVAGTATDTTITVNNLNLPTGTIAALELPLFKCAGATAANFNIAITKINGVAFAGETFTSTVKKDVSYADGNELKIEIWQDRYGTETSWKLFGTDGTTVISKGGPYTNLSSNTTQLRTETIPITATGCYRFEIYDSYGDGINNGYGTGRYRLSMNGTVFTTDDGNFGAQGTKFFGVNSLATAIDNIKYSPEKIHIFGTQSAILFEGTYQSATIYNVAGQQVAVAAANTASVTMQAGIYLVKVHIDGVDYMQKVAVK